MQFRINSWPPYRLERARNQSPALAVGQNLLEKMKHILPYVLWPSGSPGQQNQTTENVNILFLFHRDENLNTTSEK